QAVVDTQAHLSLPTGWTNCHIFNDEPACQCRRGQLWSFLNKTSHHLRDLSKTLKTCGSGEVVKRGFTHNSLLLADQKFQETFSSEWGDQLRQLAIEKSHRLAQQGVFLLLWNWTGEEALNEGEIIGKFIKQFLQICRLHLPIRRKPTYVQIRVLIDGECE